VVQETPFPVGMVQQIEGIRHEESFASLPPDLHNKMEEFKEKALLLLDLLDSSLPAVNRLKVCLHYHAQSNIDVSSSIDHVSYSSYPATS